MKEITPKDSRYVPLVQQEYCCVPTCISMLMYRHGIPLIPQEVLGYHLGLIVPMEDKWFFWNPRTGKRPPAGYGTQIYRKEYHLNTVLQKLRIPLEMVFHPISKFSRKKEFTDFLVMGVKHNKDILVCFDHGELSGDHLQGGHVCVIDRIYSTKGIVRLIDTQQSQPKWRVVKINALEHAMEFHGDDKSGGFWEFKLVKR